MERAAALRDLKLLAGSGGLDFTKGMDSLDRHVEQISFRHFRQCVTFCKHRQLKGCQHHFQPTVAKSSKRNGRNGCLKQTGANLPKRHILRTTAAERLAAPLPTNSSLVCSSHMSQMRAQSISCNPNLGHNRCIVRNKSWRP